MPQNEKEYYDSFLSDVEQGLLCQIGDSEPLMNAISKLLLADVSFKGVLRKNIKPDPTNNAALALAFSQEPKTNEELGADLRAFAEGVRLVQSGVARLAKFKTPPKGGNGKPNRGR